MRLRVTGSTLTNAFVTLVRGTQSVQNLGGFGTSSSDLVATLTLPAADTYTLFVNPAGANTGCATFTLTQVQRDRGGEAPGRCRAPRTCSRDTCRRRTFQSRLEAGGARQPTDLAV